MPKLSVITNGLVVREIQITQARTTMGRRPFNDVVFDHLAVSGEHAALVFEHQNYIIEDLNSTNGTYVNGRSVNKQILKDGDQLEIGKYTIRFDWPESKQDAHQEEESPQTHAWLLVRSGASQGRRIPLTKPMTTLGKTGNAVVTVTRSNSFYVVKFIEGKLLPTINQQVIQTEGQPFHHGDVLKVGDIELELITDI